MRNSFLAGMFLSASLLVAPSCVGDVAEVDEQSSDALVGVGEDSSGDEANPANDTNAVAPDPDRDAITQCPAGSMCLWNLTFWGGAFYMTAAGGCTNIPFAFNNLASSWYNYRGARCDLFANFGCMGASVTAPAGAANSSMGFLNNAVSSVSCL